MENSLPPIPAKRYFTISEVSNLCGVKPHVLRYWEQVFIQLRPMKRRGNRRYYQIHEVELIRQIRQLLYEQGFTVVGARNKLQELLPNVSGERFDIGSIFLQMKSHSQQNGNTTSSVRRISENAATAQNMTVDDTDFLDPEIARPLFAMLRLELRNIRDLLGPIG